MSTSLLGFKDHFGGLLRFCSSGKIPGTHFFYEHEDRISLGDINSWEYSNSKDSFFGIPILAQTEKFS